jgi:hypothetical protein
MGVNPLRAGRAVCPGIDDWTMTANVGSSRDGRGTSLAGDQCVDQ